MQTPFLGAHYVSRSKNLSDEQCVNLYLALIEAGIGKARGGLFTTPGLDPTSTVGTGPIRGLHVVRGVPTGTLPNKPQT